MLTKGGCTGVYSWNERETLSDRYGDSLHFGCGGGRQPNVLPSTSLETCPLKAPRIVQSGTPTVKEVVTTDGTRM